MRRESVPRAIIVAGPNGSGKSTLIEQLRRDKTLHFPDRYTNADNIAAQFAETMPQVTQEERERLAFREARSLRLQYRKEQVSHAFETVFSHPSTLLDMRALREAGFEITLYLVTTERPEINIERVARRVREGGHNVPVERIRDRYHRVMHLLPCAVERADYTYVFDSSRTDVRTGMPTTRLVATFRAEAVQRTETVPAFLLQALLTPLRERADERQQIEANLASIETLILPDESMGVYGGTILAAHPYYSLQRTAPATIVRHDNRLLTSSSTAGATVAIVYKDGYGTSENQFE